MTALTHSSNVRGLLTFLSLNRKRPFRFWSAMDQARSLRHLLRAEIAGFVAAKQHSTESRALEIAA